MKITPDTEKKAPRQISSTAALQSAIVTLEQFARKSKTESVLPITDLAVHEGKLVAVKGSRFQKIVSFIAGLLSRKTRQEYRQRKQQVQEVVLHAIDTVKRNHLLLNKFMEGAPDEQKLASSTLEAIKRYNAAWEERQSQLSLRWSDRLSRYLSVRSGLSIEEDLPPTPIDLPQHVVALPRREEQEIAQTASPLMTQEADVIRMKANTLLRQHGIKFKSTAEVVSSVKAAPIHATVNSQAQTSTVCLTLDVLPGTSIKIQGSFKRHPEAHSAPIPDSFDLSIKSSHTGFPHPSQRCGWALSDALLPVYPHRLDLLPTFEPLYVLKKDVALELLPNGRLLERAQDALRMRQNVFIAHQKEFLGLHKILFQAILEAAPKERVPKGAKKTISSFFTQLAKGDAWNSLVEACQMWNQVFILEPQARLQEAWVTNPESLSRNVNQAQHFLDISETTPQDSFQEVIGRILRPSIHAIILQSWSETLEVASPVLEPFDKCVQAAAYIQLKDFLEEVTEEAPSHDPQYIYNKMHSQLLADIALFQAGSVEAVGGFPAAIVEELHGYFKERMKDEG